MYWPEWTGHHFAAHESSACEPVILMLILFWGRMLLSVTCILVCNSEQTIFIEK